MNEIKISPGIQILIFFILVLVMGSISDIVFVLSLPLFIDAGVNPEDIDFSEPTLMLARYFIYSSFSFILSFLLFLRFTRQKLRDVIQIDKMKIRTTLMILAIVVGAMIVMEILSLINEPLKELLPNNSLIQAELETRLDQFNLLNHDNPVRLIFSLFIIAFIPAVGEELAFRGVLQGKLLEASKNRHFAVIVSSLIFAGMHLSPLQLLPMIFMGVCFGYIYLHTRNIKYPILMHFINNATMVTLVYFNPDLMTI